MVLCSVHLACVSFKGDKERFFNSRGCVGWAHVPGRGWRCAKCWCSSLSSYVLHSNRLRLGVRGGRFWAYQGKTTKRSTDYARSLNRDPRSCVVDWTSVSGMGIRLGIKRIFAEYRIRRWVYSHSDSFHLNYDTQTLLRLRIRSSNYRIYIELCRYLLQKYVKDGSFMYKIVHIFVFVFVSFLEGFFTFVFAFILT